MFIVSPPCNSFVILIAWISFLLNLQLTSEGQNPPFTCPCCFNAENPSSVGPICKYSSASDLFETQHGHQMKWRGTFWKRLGGFLSQIPPCGSTWLGLVTYFIKPAISICDGGAFHPCLCLTKAKYHGCHWLPMIGADGFIIQIFPKRAGRSIAAPLSCGCPSMLIVTNISCLDGGTKSVWWRLKQLPEVMDELCGNQNVFFFTLYLMLRLHSLGFGGDFLALDEASPKTYLKRFQFVSFL